MTQNKIESLKKQLLEDLAELEHEQWAHWINYQKEKIDNEGFHKVDAWIKLALTPYAKLSDEEKESDREWARKVLKIFEPSLKQIADLTEKFEVAGEDGFLDRANPSRRRPAQEVGVYDPMEQAGHSDMISWSVVEPLLQEADLLRGRLSAIQKHLPSALTRLKDDLAMFLRDYGLHSMAHGKLLELVDEWAERELAVLLKLKEGEKAE